MNTHATEYLIFSTPAEVVIPLVIFAGLAGLIVFLLAAEDGRYPEFGRAVAGLKSLRARVQWSRRVSPGGFWYWKGVPRGQN